MTSPIPPPIPSHPSECACIDLINSAFSHHLGKGPGFDRLSQPVWRAWFLRRHGLDVGPQDSAPIEELTVLRTQLRTILERWARVGSLQARDAQILDRWVGSTPLFQRVKGVSGQVELTIEPVRRDWNWVMGAIAVSAVELVASHPPERLKVCANPDCSWMFYDHTLNRSKRFCSTSPCGNVVRVRQFRRRRTAV